MSLLSVYFGREGSREVNVLPGQAQVWLHRGAEQLKLAKDLPGK